MAFVYEKIPEEEKENLKIKLKEAEKWVEEIQEQSERLYPLKMEPMWWLDFYEFPKDNSWVIDREKNYAFVKYGYSYFKYSGRDVAYTNTSLNFMFINNNIIAVTVTPYIHYFPECCLYVSIDEFCIPKILESRKEEIVETVKRAIEVLVSGENKMIFKTVNIEFEEEIIYKYI